MAGSTSAKTLAAKYGDFTCPNTQILASGKVVALEEGRSLEYVEVSSSTGRNPDMAVLVYRVEKAPSSNLTSMEKYLPVGEKIEIKIGYDKSTSRVFLGYLHELEISDYGRDSVEYTLLCLDVKGLMKKNSSYGFSGTKKLQQILTGTIDNSSYAPFVTKKTVSTLPTSLNVSGLVKGETDYDWLCSLAEYLNYEFFCDRGELIFRKSREGVSEQIELTADYGLQAVKRVISLANQTGGIQVKGYNRMGQQLVGNSKHPGMSGTLGGKLKSTLGSSSLVLWDMELETGEQAESRAKALMNRGVAQCSCIHAVNVGIPELHPGIYVKITKEDHASLSQKIYVEEVRHVLDGRGYQTTIRGTYDY